MKKNKARNLALALKQNARAVITVLIVWGCRGMNLYRRATILVGNGRKLVNGMVIIDHPNFLQCPA